MINKLKKYMFELLLGAVVVYLFINNYVPGTYLTGWDNLQTELDPALGLKRAFFSVWQEYQSFGLVGGMAHASDIVRAIVVWVMTFFLPQSLVRYVSVFSLLFIGGIGMLKLLELLGLTGEKKKYGFLGALFYMLNLGTVQVFALPFEAFIIFFAALPWEVWIFLRLLVKEGEEISKKNLLFFFVINLLSTPQAYVQTLFVVYLLLLGCLWLGMILIKRTLASLMRGLSLFIIIILINLFWILPQAYFLKTSRYVVKESKVNQFASDDLLFTSRDKGVKEFLRLTGFYYDLSDSRSQQIFSPWKSHFTHPLINFLPYVFVAVAIIGLFSRTFYTLPILFSLGLMMVALINSIPPFSYLNSAFRENQFVNIIFRDPFTKFIIPYSLIYSLLFALGLSKLAHKLGLSQQSKTTWSLAFVILLFLSSLPSFKGHFIAPQMKVEIPEEYFEIMDYFKSEDKNKRITLLPDNTVWGWFIHKWGYDGSGFLWYGIEQPIVSRTFDVWSNKSEGYYWEMKTALESTDTKKLQRVLEKFAIDYIIFDKSILPLSASYKGMQYEKITEMLAKIDTVALVKSWNNVSVYKITHEYPADSYVSVLNNLPNIGPSIKITNEDTAYEQFGTYMTDISKPYDAYFPFLDLMTQARIQNKTWEIQETDNQISLLGKFDIDPDQYTLFLQYSKPVLLNSKDGIATMSAQIKLDLKEREILATIDKNLLYSSSETDGYFEECGIVKGSTEKAYEENGLRIKAWNGSRLCFSFAIPYLEQRYGYLLKILNENKEGRRLYLYVVDKTKKQTYLEDRLLQNKELYLLPPNYQYGVGYDLQFENQSYIHIPSENRINELAVYFFPYESIKELHFRRRNSSVKRAFTMADSLKAAKVNYYAYTVDLQKIKKDSALTFFQTYEPGWKAYLVNDRIKKSKFKSFFAAYFPFLFGTELKEHVLVNNWANGWRISNQSSVISNQSKTEKLTTENRQLITVIFWPQYLEFIGFILLGASLLAILRLKS